MATAGVEQFPLLIFPEPTRIEREAGTGFPSQVHYPDRPRQSARISAGLDRLQVAFEARALELRAQAQGDDPDLVLVLEIVGAVDDFITTAQRVPGLEWLAATDAAIDPDEDFFQYGDQDARLGGKLFLIGSNRGALAQVVRLFELYRQNEQADLGPGLSAWKQVFARLKSVRFWSPADRLQADLRDAWLFQLEHGSDTVRFEIEAWHFNSAARNAAAGVEIRALVNQLGGTVLQEIRLDEIAYHGLLVEMPALGVRQILDDAAPLLRSDRVMFFRAQGQTVVQVWADDTRTGEHPIPGQRVDGSPVVALLDGLPMANHPLVEGRVLIDDPDDWGDTYLAAERLHGTAMASLIAHGDLSASEVPLRRPIYARPILQPTGPVGRRVERTPDGQLLVDLIHQAVRRMFESLPGRPAAAPEVKVVSLALGDATRPFGGEMSPLARLLDWLQHKYKVLVLVSAGNSNNSTLVLDTAPGTLQGMTPLQREAIATRALLRDDLDRRILAPAESVNALTIGAIHADASTVPQVPGRYLLFAERGIAPYSAPGPGFRRGIKPDILLPGGRCLYREVHVSPPGRTEMQGINSPQPPGHKVAAPPTAQGQTCFTRGTSNATALGARWGARAHEVLEVLRAGRSPLEPRFDAVLIKALLAHGARLDEVQAALLAARPDVEDWYAQRRLLSRYGGLGVADIDRALTCTAQRATLVGIGALKNNKALEFKLPMPVALHANVVRRRITATLAWMTPINPRHSKYRVARMWLDLPNEPMRGDRVQGEHRQLRLGTVHHEIFESARALAVVDDTTQSIRVNCMADAGRIDLPIEFALCVSLEVAEGVGLPIYQQVRERVAQRVGVRAVGPA